MLSFKVANGLMLSVIEEIKENLKFCVYNVYFAFGKCRKTLPRAWSFRRVLLINKKLASLRSQGWGTPLYINMEIS